MKLRMVPIKQVFDRFPAWSGILVVPGEKGSPPDYREQTELDRSIVNRLADPVHLIRNAIDHGIEPETEREARQKPENNIIAGLS